MKVGKIMKNLYKEVLSKVNKGESNMSIVIDGIVGVGKSTIMELLEKEGYTAFPEPVVNNPILDKFYYNRTRWSFPLQIFFLNERFKHIKNCMKLGEHTVQDRSIYGDVIFAKMLCDSGEMTEEEFELYKDLLENMLHHITPPKLMVYLEVSTDEAMKRIKRRGRDYEQIVEREYWDKLNEEYRAYFEGYNISPILKINVDNLNYADNEEDKQYILKLIADKLAEIEGV